MWGLKKDEKKKKQEDERKSDGQKNDRQKNDRTKKWPLPLRILKWIFIVVVCLAVLFGIYMLYMQLTYHRLPDHLQLKVEETAGDAVDTSILAKDQLYTILTYNVGFGAYTPDYSFFMDGGKYSWAKSKQSVIDTINGAGGLMQSYQPDFAMIEEVDTDSTRSYHVDESKLLDQFFPGFYRSDAIDFDSSFLAFPIWQPHGFCRAEMSLYSKYGITSSERRSLPIATSISKFFDLDRCYSISKIPMEDGHDLCLYMLHLSAYGSDDSIRKAQVGMLVKDMETDVKAGNYVICGGDFNHDLKAKWGTQGEVEWACPFPKQDLPEGMHFYIDTIPENITEAMHDSARNDDIPYTKGVTYTVTLDGFIVSDNVDVQAYEIPDTGYQYSDHEPVVMKFKLK